MKNIFEYMLWSNPKNPANSYEQHIYEQQSHFFDAKTSVFNDSVSLFGLIKSDIILRGLLNRHIMNADINQFTKEQLAFEGVQRALTLELPYFLFHGNKIYIPTYDLQTNQRYDKAPYELKDDFMENDGDHVIDPFAVYGNSIFDSPFTRLVKLNTSKNGVLGFYHVEFKNLFFITANGSLEQEIPLFNEKCKTVMGNQIWDKLEKVCQAYFEYDPSLLLSVLKEEGFISTSFYEECVEEYEKMERKKKV